MVCNLHRAAALPWVPGTESWSAVEVAGRPVQDLRTTDVNYWQLLRSWDRSEGKMLTHLQFWGPAALRWRMCPGGWRRRTATRTAGTPASWRRRRRTSSWWCRGDPCRAWTSTPATMRCYTQCFIWSYIIQGLTQSTKFWRRCLLPPLLHSLMLMLKHYLRRHLSHLLQHNHHWVM